MRLYIQGVISFLASIYVHVDAQGIVNPPIDPIVLNINVRKHGPNPLELPFEHVPQAEDTNVIRACPAESPQDINLIKSLSRKYYKMGYCVFERTFKPEESKICRQEPKPVLSEVIGKQSLKPVKCGPKKHHQLYQYGYYYCGKTDRLRLLDNKKTRKNNMDNFEIGTTLFEMYELCIDKKKGFALWTKHVIMTPPMYLNPANEAKLQYEEDNSDISTDTLIFKGKYNDMKKKYTNQNANDEKKMNASLMIPKEHMALRPWKKAINHYMIAASLWVNLQYLMDEFNDAMKRLSLILYEQNKILVIYTKVQPLSTWGWNENEAGSSVFGKNLWYRLLYEEKTKLAMLVVIQNNPKKPPTTKTELCAAEIECDKKSWFAKVGREVSNVTDEHLNYMVCCNTNTDEVLKLFDRHLHIDGKLNIDGIFAENYQKEISRKAPRHPPQNYGPAKDSSQSSNSLKEIMQEPHQTSKGIRV